MLLFPYTLIISTCILKFRFFRQVIIHLKVIGIQKHISILILIFTLEIIEDTRGEWITEML